MFIVNGLSIGFRSSEGAECAEANGRLKHFAPLELLFLGDVACL